MPDSGVRVIVWKQWSTFEKIRFGVAMAIMLALSLWGLSQGYWMMVIFLAIAVATLGYVLLARVPRRQR
jgi:hypothetical protein